MEENKALIKLIKDELKLPSPKSKCTWAFSGNYVLYLYHLILQDIISQKYEKPDVIDIICTTAVYNKLLKLDRSKLTNKKGLIFELSGNILINIICIKNNTIFAEADNMKDYHIININHLMELKKNELELRKHRLHSIFLDIDYIAKIILFRRALVTDEKDTIVDIVAKLQQEI